MHLDSGAARPIPDARDVAIPGYEDLREIGRGSFGVVFRGFQPEFDRFVAIKVLTGLRDATARRRFDRERRSLGKLSGHPHIVTVYASGFTPDGSPYLVMEYLDGGSLAERLGRGPLPWPDAVGIGGELASAVQAAHDVGVLHRDIKPENVLIAGHGAPKLADFGIAFLQGGTETGSGFTPLHAAPEILAGAAASSPSDVYSLASTVYTLIAGRAPFWRDGDDSILPLMARVVNEPVPDLRPVGIPDGICAALEHAMAKDPTERLGPAEELGRRFNAVLAERGSATTLVPPRPPEPPPPEIIATPPTARRRRRVLIGGLVGIALITVIAISVATWRTGSQSAHRPNPPNKPTDPGQVATRLLALTNKLRNTHGLNPLRSDPRLATIATGFAQQLESKTLADVQQIPRSDLQNAITGQVGANWSKSGTNSVPGAATADDAQRATENEPTHVANLVDPVFNDVGIGVTIGPGKRIYVVEVFIDLHPPAA